VGRLPSKLRRKEIEAVSDVMTSVSCLKSCVSSIPLIAFCAGNEARLKAVAVP
jgi:hypothetical protein